jgi:hypothetical protein
MRSKSVPTHERVVAELMRPELGISTKAADESARRPGEHVGFGHRWPCCISMLH